MKFNRALLLLVLSLAAGIFVSEQVRDICIGHLPLFFLLILPFIALAYYCHRSFSHRWARLLFYPAVSVGVMLTGGLLYALHQKDVRVEWEQNEYDFNCQAVSVPQDRGNYYLVDADILNGEAQGQRIRLLLAKPDSVEQAPAQIPEIGSRIVVHGRMLGNHLRNPGDFDYGKYLRLQGFSGSLYSDAWFCASDENLSRPLGTAFLKFRSKLTEQFARYFDHSELAVLSAMTLGDKSKLDRDLRNEYQAAGASHVLALSGLHLGILFTLLNLLFRLFLSKGKRHNLLTLAVTLLVVWGYTLVADAPLSLMRAAIMLTFLQLSVLSGRDVMSFDNLFWAALIILLIFPMSVFDLGFQLSFLSVFFIIWGLHAIPVPQFVAKHRVLQACYTFCLVPLCAQIGTMPLVCYAFHQIPVYGLLTNFFVVPMAYGVLILTILFFALTPLRDLLVVLLGGLLHKMNEMISFVSQLPGAVLTYWPSSTTILLLYLTLFLIVALGFERLRHLEYRLSVIVVFLFAVGAEIYAYRPDRTPSQILVYHNPKALGVHFIISADKSYLYTYPEDEETYQIVLKQAEPTIKTWHLSNIVHIKDDYADNSIMCSDPFIIFGNKRVLILKDAGLMSDVKAPISVDVVIPTNVFRQESVSLLNTVRPRTIILPASLYKSVKERWKVVANEANVPVYDISLRGFWLETCDNSVNPSGLSKED